MLDRLSYWLDRSSLYIALLAAWIAMLGSLYFSEVAHYIPCSLCWYQRILMYPLTLVIAVGLLRRDENTPLLVLPFSLLGIGVSTYHVLLEKTDWFSSDATCQVGVPCTVIWINWFGFLTIPFLALIAFLVISVMMVVAWQAGEPAIDEDEAPHRMWVPVFGIIVAVVVAFILLIQFSTQPTQAQSAFTVVETNAPMMQPNGTPVGGIETSATADGVRLYLEACAVCHGPKGEGVTGLGGTLVDSTFVQESTADELLAMIRAGRSASDPANQSGLVMPPSGGRPDLSDADLLAIGQVLRNGMVVGDGEAP
jgi:disulfide bond formation protein DsbB/mono/diheme cytochrome c family protein